VSDTFISLHITRVLNTVKMYKRYILTVFKYYENHFLNRNAQRYCRNNQRGQVYWSGFGVGRSNRNEAILMKYPSHINLKLGEITNINANSASFDFLKDEPDLY